MKSSFVLLFVVLVSVGTFARFGAADDDLIPSSVWYDSQDQTLKPVPVEPSIDDSPNRASRWLPKPKDVPQASGNPNTGGVTGDTSIFGQAFGWILLSAVAITLIVLIVYAIRNSEANLFRPLGTTARDGGPDNATRERMKELPAELQEHSGDLRSEAERYMREGNFNRAIVCLYGHQLLLLDHHAWLRLSRGKTNHRYVREVRSKSSGLSELLKQTVNAFEKSYFGRHDITADEVRGIWQSNGELERTVDQDNEAAA